MPPGTLAQGLHDVRRGFAFLGAHPGLWRWVVGPALVSLVLLGALGFGVLTLATRTAGAVTEHLPAVLAGVATAILVTAFVIVLAAGALLVFAAVAGLISGPFCERLSEAVEEILSGTPAPPFAPLHYAKELARGAGHALRRVVTAVLGAVLLFALSWVPVIGAPVAIALGAYVAARASAYDCYDAVLGRRQMAYRDKLAFLAARRARSLGLGAGVAGLLLVPGLGLVALGVGAIGATLAIADERPPSLPTAAPATHAP